MLKQIRESKGLTQEELAASVGLTRNSISQYETGRAFPSAPVMFKLAHALDTTVDVLFGASFKLMDTVFGDCFQPADEEVSADA